MRFFSKRPKIYDRRVRPPKIWGMCFLQSEKGFYFKSYEIGDLEINDKIVIIKNYKKGVDIIIIFSLDLVTSSQVC